MLRDVQAMLDVEVQDVLDVEVQAMLDMARAAWQMAGVQG